MPTPYNYHNSDIAAIRRAIITINDANQSNENISSIAIENILENIENPHISLLIFIYDDDIISGLNQYIDHNASVDQRRLERHSYICGSFLHFIYRLKKIDVSCKLELTSFFFSKGFDKDSQDDFGQTLIHLTAFNSDIFLLNFLLAHNANPNIIDKLNRTPLFYADDIFSITILLGYGANINILDRTGDSVLHLIDKPEFLRIFIRFGHAINIVNTRNQTLLHHTKNVEIAEILLQKHPEMVLAVDNFGNTALHYSCGSNSYKKTELILKHNPDINHKNHNNQSALDLSIFKESEVFFELDINLGAHEESEILLNKITFTMLFKKYLTIAEKNLLENLIQKFPILPTPKDFFYDFFLNDFEYIKINSSYDNAVNKVVIENFIGKFQYLNKISKQLKQHRELEDKNPDLIKKIMEILINLDNKMYIACLADFVDIKVSDEVKMIFVKPEKIFKKLICQKILSPATKTIQKEPLG